MATVARSSLSGMFYLCCLVLLNPVHAQNVARPARADLRALDLRVLNVSPSLNVIDGSGGNVVVWSGADGVVLVDSGSSDTTPQLADAVARIAPSPVKFVINTHGHADHTGGNETFVRQGATVIGHEMLRARAGRDPAVPAGNPEALAPNAAGRPTLTTSDALALHLNGDRLQVIHVADAHTAGDLVLRFDQADVVVLGDIYWNGQYPFVDVDSGGSMAGTVAAVEAALARANARTVIVPGHGPVSNRAELAAYRDMLVSVGRKVRQAVEQGMDVEAILATKPTAEFDARYVRPDAAVAPDEFVRSVYRDLAPKQRPGR